MTPQTLLKLLLLAGVVLLVLAIGLRARLSQPLLVLRRPQLALRAVLAMYVALPAFVLLAVALLPLRPGVGAALLALAVSTVLPPWAKKGAALGGGDDYVIGLQLLSCAVSLLAAPLMIAVAARLFGVETVLAPWAVEKVLLATVAAPLAVGLGLARLGPAGGSGREGGRPGAAAWGGGGGGPGPAGAGDAGGDRPGHRRPDRGGGGGGPAGGARPGRPGTRPPRRAGLGHGVAPSRRGAAAGDRRAAAAPAHGARHGAALSDRRPAVADSVRAKAESLSGAPGTHQRIRQERDWKPSARRRPGRSSWALVVQAREGQGASGRRRHAGLGLRDGFFTTGVIDPTRAVGLGLTRALTIRRAAQTLGKPARPLMEKGTEAGQRPCGPAKTCTQRLPAPQHRSDQNRKRPPPKKNAQGSWKICPLYTSAMNSSPLSAPTLAAALAGLSLLAPSAAQALTIPVTVGGQIYDVTYTDPAITYTGNESLFNTASNGGKMPWWNTQALAEQFATLVGDSLGLPNTGFGPFFSWEYRDDGQGGTNVETWAFDPAISAPAAESPSASGFNFYATATLRDPSAAVPGPLPLFGAAAAFGMSRRLRQRIRRTS